MLHSLHSAFPSVSLVFPSHTSWQYFVLILKTVSNAKKKKSPHHLPILLFVEMPTSQNYYFKCHIPIQVLSNHCQANSLHSTIIPPVPNKIPSQPSFIPSDAIPNKTCYWKEELR
jgi:hypothetical protein